MREPTRILPAFPVLPALLTLLLLPVLGCEKEHPAHEHNFAARHGGKLIENHNHRPMIEWLQDTAAGKVTVWVYDGEQEALALTEAPKVRFAGETPREVVATGQGDTWSLTDDALKTAAKDIAVSVHIDVEGKAYAFKLE